jgi:hypothetical protein
MKCLGLTYYLDSKFNFLVTFKNINPTLEYHLLANIRKKTNKYLYLIILKYRVFLEFS